MKIKLTVMWDVRAVRDLSIRQQGDFNGLTDIIVGHWCSLVFQHVVVTTMLYRVPSPVRVILTVTRKAQSVYGDLQPYLVVVYRFPSCKCYWRFPRGIRGFCYSEGTRVREGGIDCSVALCSFNSPGYSDSFSESKECAWRLTTVPAWSSW